ncbi:CPBP family intramembrane metalloprotease [Flavobacteriaceae bacterium AU392]|nr:CPBP family intramembrane metalloprotease [Flavobacteriaceae bacterium]RKM85016.1 CPBP family intramembrane metalloprotease [Flavobacteriaceae bacterium AU392]
MKLKLYNALTKPYIVILVMLFAPLLGYFDRNYSFFFGLGFVALILWSSNYNWSLFGFTKKLTKKTILKSVLLTVFLILFDNTVGTIVQNYLGDPNLSSIDVKGDTLNYIIILIVVWTLVAFGEEFLFKGYYFKWLANFLGNTKKAWLLAGIISSIYFGASHYYQGISGMITISIITMFTSFVFYKNRNNLCVLILMHGLHDTWGLTFLYLGKPSPVKQFFEQLLLT